LFSPSVSTPKGVPIGAGNGSLVRGDFNGDTVLDFATTRMPEGDGSSGADLALFEGNGDGSFRQAGPLTLGIPAGALTVGDFNEDGRLDLAATFSGPAGLAQGVGVVLGNGDGTFQVGRTVAAEGGTSLAAGDFDGDGHLDLAFANRVGGTIGLLL